MSMRVFASLIWMGASVGVGVFCRLGEFKSRTLGFDIDHRT
jgi:hypothetical protein